MTEAQTGIAVLIGTSIAVSGLVHWHERRLVRGVLAASVISTVVFQVLAYLHAGYLDPFFLIAVVVSGAMSACIAAFVGIVFLLYRRARDRDHDDRRS